MFLFCVRMGFGEIIIGMLGLHCALFLFLSCLGFANVGVGDVEVVDCGYECWSLIVWIVIAFCVFNGGSC